MRILRPLAALCVVLAFLLPVACGSSSSSDRAVAASPGVLEAIAAGAQDGTGMKPLRGMVVKSNDFENVYFVAVEFSAAGIDNQVGVWATNNPDWPEGNGVIYSVDGFAQEFTDWGNGGATDANLSMSDDGAEEAKAALQ